MKKTDRVGKAASPVAGGIYPQFHQSPKAEANRHEATR